LFFPPATWMGLRRDWVVLVITDEVVLGGNIYLMLCRDDDSNACQCCNVTASAGVCFGG